MTKLVKLLAIGGSSTAVAGGAAAGVAVAVTHKKDNKAQNKGYDLTIEAMDKTLAANAKSSLDAELAAKAAVEEAARKAFEEMKAAIEAMDKTLAATALSNQEAEEDAKYEYERTLAHAEHQMEKAHYNENIGKDELALHEAEAEKNARDAAIEEMKAAIEAMDRTAAAAALSNQEAEEDAKYEYERALAHADHQIENAFYNENLEKEELANRNAEKKNEISHKLHELTNEREIQEALDEQAKFDAIISNAKVVSVKAHATLNELLNLASRVETIDTTVASFSQDIKQLELGISSKNIDVISKAIESITNLSPTIESDISKVKTAQRYHAGNVVKVIRTIVSEQYDMSKLFGADAKVNGYLYGSVGDFWAVGTSTRLGEIQETLKNILISVMPSMESELEALFKNGNKDREFFYQSEYGASRYGVNLGIFDWLLNPENETKENFADFTRGNLRAPQASTGNQYRWSDAELQSWLTKFDNSIMTAGHNTEASTMDDIYVSHQQTVDKLASDIENGTVKVIAPNSANIASSAWIANKNFVVVTNNQLANNVKLSVIKATANADRSKVDVELLVNGSYATPSVVKTTIDGFKVSTAPTPAQFVAELKNRLEHDSAAKGILSAGFGTAPAAKLVLTKYLSDLHVTLDRNVIDKIIGTRPGNLFYKDTFRANISAVTYHDFIKSINTSQCANEAVIFAHAMDTL